jgi:kinesin family protein 16B
MAGVRVAVRVRPFNGRERQLDSRLVVEMAGETQVSLLPAVQEGQAAAFAGDKHKPHNFAFDHAYWSHDPGDRHYTPQDRVFTDLGQDVVKNAFGGYNVCVFAYGQTGSGKTYTMMGSEKDRGLIPRICESMFLKMVEGTTYKVEVSYLEIYNERVKDLLKKNSSHNLKVREHPSQGPYVEDLSKHLVTEYRNILRLMEQGNDLRTTASTNMNDTSSRSHAIFTINFVQAGYMSGMPYETQSKIHLVDLAGSERANATGATGQRLKEGAHINKSLVTLGSVISALAEAGSKVKPGQAKGFIPYRDSVLTWLLKDSLGGNSKTIMIATISPAEINHSEILSTLRYANRAKNIINKPTVNEDPNVKLIRELREEIDRMRALMSGDPAMLIAIEEQLKQKEAKEQKLTEEWNEKWREAAKILQEHNALGLKRTGLGVVLDSDKPHLIGLDEDILSTGITLYQLKEGETVIGNTDNTEEIPHILLKGPSILPRHCCILLEGGTATLHPHPGSLCLVNAAPIEEPVRLSQGCVIVLGKTNMFRYNDPLEAADLRRSMTEKSRKTSLMNQSLLSQSLSDLRNPPGR